MQRIAGKKQNGMKKRRKAVGHNRRKDKPAREKLRKVEYFVSENYNPDAGFMDGGNEDDKTDVGLFHRYADSYRICKDAYCPLTKAIIEIEATGEIKHIETTQIKRFIND
ncbi:hypothetical protein [uncultured Rikenella sp.]|uniref:hypothetical protein n=1 Tax=uncultured Rikenella sp. TaxID=368003 RepID=UPI00262B4E49|nr:hypothetical protein [uncultured Rikenella sp.]